MIGDAAWVPSGAMPPLGPEPRLGAAPAGAPLAGGPTSDDLLEQVAVDLRASLARALTGLLASAEAADQAVEEGSCLLEGGTLAWRLDLDNLMVELFCDIGLPEPALAREAWRFALEANLCRTCEGAYLGLHPESGHLVMTSGLPAVLMLDDSMAEKALASLARQAREMREAAGFSWG